MGAMGATWIGLMFLHSTSHSWFEGRNGHSRQSEEFPTRRPGIDPAGLQTRRNTSNVVGPGTPRGAEANMYYRWDPSHKGALQDSSHNQNQWHCKNASSL